MFCPGCGGAKTRTRAVESSGVGLFDHHDRVGAGRHRRAGGDFDALTGSDRLHRHLAGEDLLDAAQRTGALARGAGRVGGAHRVAVHRRAREGRHVGVGDDVAREHAAVRVVERHALDALERRDRRGDDRPRLARAASCLRTGASASESSLLRSCCTRAPSSGMIRRVIARRTAFSDPGSTKIALPRHRAGGRAAHHRRRADLLEAEHAEQLAESVQALLEQAVDGFEGAVARRDAGAAGGDDDLRRGVVSHCLTRGA